MADCPSGSVVEQKRATFQEFRAASLQTYSSIHLPGNTAIRKQIYLATRSPGSVPLSLSRRKSR